MAFGLKNYDADQVVVVFGPVAIFTGRGDGDFLTVEFDEDAFSLSVGSDGEGTRSKTNNRSATITLVLQQTADANGELSALYNLDINSPGGAGVYPLQISDKSGRSLYVAESAWVQKLPTSTFGRESGTREWILRTHNLVANVDGN